MSTFLVRMNDGFEALTADDVADAIFHWDENQGGMERSQIDVQKIAIKDTKGVVGPRQERIVYTVEEVA